MRRHSTKKTSLNSTASLVREASAPKIGESEDDAKERVKNIFKKELDYDSQFKDMSEEDIEEYEELLRRDSK
jgi:hypothetical protein